MAGGVAQHVGLTFKPQHHKKKKKKKDVKCYQDIFHNLKIYVKEHFLLANID
jgi:hypothetical protein